ncbi:MAG: hypothetical protein O7C75_13940, partial [Verrucomicrobia bacterium]|nr:hypothetical protein [Verrucomicrobiota bacterium]
MQPGDTIWLRGGTYVHSDRTSSGRGYKLDLAGSATAPITIRNYNGERARIDGGLYTNGGDPKHLRIQGLEIFVSELAAAAAASQDGLRYSAQTGSHSIDLPGPKGNIILINGHDLKFINNVIHDCRQGVSFWGSVDGDSEIYGNIIYRNGWIAPDRSHGPGIYTQNYKSDDLHGDRKLIRDNIVLDNYSIPLQAYGSDLAFVENFLIEGNIFQPLVGSGRNYVVVGGIRPSTLEPNEFRDNLVLNGNLRIGSVDGGDTIYVTGNTLVEGTIDFKRFTNLIESDNIERKSGWRMNVQGFDSGDYTTGALPGQGSPSETYDNLVLSADVGNTWSGTGGAEAPRIVEKSPGNLALELNSSRSVRQISRDIVDTTGSISTYYNGFASMILNVSTIPDQANPVAQMASNSGEYESITLGIRPSSGGTRYQVGITTGTQIGTAQFTTIELDPSTDYVIAWRWTHDVGGSASLWVNPGSMDSDSPDAVSTGAPDYQNAIQFFQRNSPHETFENSYVLTVDNLAFGGSFAEVYQDGTTLPMSAVVVLRTNEYEKGRANLAIYQPGIGANTVAVDFGSFLSSGDTFQILEPQDIWGSPVQTGTYTGAPVHVEVGGESISVFVVENIPSIQAGSNLARLSNHTAFGDAVINLDTVSRIYTIRNNGSTVLSLSGAPVVTLSGSDF